MTSPTASSASADALLLPEFERQFIDTGSGPVLTLTAGSGPPLLMLHGDPQTHLCWHQIAPTLANDFTVVLTDIRGRGETHKPGATNDHEPYSKRSMANEQLMVMESLGHHRFDVIAHDRGARVARRLTLDHPDAVASLTCLDIVPAIDLYNATTAAFAQDYFYFYFLTQPHPAPERLISGDPEGFIRQLLVGLTGSGHSFNPAAFETYLDMATTPEAIEAMCECFRAGYALDIEHDQADREAGKTINCPTLVLWGEHGVLGRHLNIADIWSRWSTDLTVVPIRSGHFLPEEASHDVLKAFRDFALIDISGARPKHREPAPHVSRRRPRRGDHDA